MFRNFVASDFDTSTKIELDPSPALFALQMDILGREIRSFREPLKRSIQLVLGPSFRQNFDVGGRPSWVPLAQSTIDKKQRIGAKFVNEVLMETGKLRRVAGQLNAWKIEGGYLAEEAKAYVDDLPGAEYGAVHQFGNDHVPERAFLIIQDEDQSKIEEVFGLWLDERLAQYGKFRMA